MGNKPKNRDRNPLPRTPVAATPGKTMPAAMTAKEGLALLNAFAAPVATTKRPSNPWLALQLMALGLALGLVAYAAYANSFHTGLVLDNSVIIGTDPRITAVNYPNIEAIFTRNYWWPAFESNLYRPLTTLTYLFNYAVIGGGHSPTDPFGYHVFNFILHWANVGLVLVIVRRLTQRLDVAVLAAALFAVHPVNVESVTNIIGRADLLATLSILLGVWCYVRAADTSGWRKFLWLTGTAVNAIWGGFTKESAILICGFVFLYDMLWRWPALPGATFFKRVLRALVEFGLKGWIAVAPGAVLVLVVHFYMKFHSPVFGEVYVDNPISGADSWWHGCMSAIYILGRYLALMVFPRTLSCDYSYHQIPLYGEPGAGAVNLLAWVSLAAIVALIAWAIKCWRTQPLYAAGIGIFFIMQLPTANLLFPIGSIMGERFLYLPSLGFCMVAAQTFSLLMDKQIPLAGANRGRRIAARGILPAIAIFALGARTYARNADWKDELSLWQSAAAAEPGSFKVHKGLANAIMGQAVKQHPGDYIAQEKALDAAIAEAEKGLFILDHPLLPTARQDNTLFQDMGRFYTAKGQYLEHRNQPDEAKAAYQKAVDILLRAVEVDHYANQASRASSLQRGRPESEIVDVGNFNVYILITMAYGHLRDWPNAEASARYALHLAPLEAKCYRLLADVLANSGKLPDASVQILEAMLLNPNDQDLWQILATYFQAMGFNPNPITPVGDHFSLNPSDPRVRQMLNQAGVGLVQSLLVYKQPGLAEQIRQKCVTAYQIPPELFDQK